MAKRICLSPSDRTNLSLPITEEERYEVELWLHTDQSNRRPERFGVQGFVNLQPAGPQDGSLVVLEGSHLLHGEYFAEHGFDSAEDYWALGGEDHIELAWFRNRGCTVRKVEAPAGSLVLWNSKTFHCNAPGVITPGQDPRVRMAVYVSMGLRRLASTPTLRKRQEAFTRGLGTTHDATKCFTFPPYPGGEGYDEVRARYQWSQPEPRLTQAGLRLAGF